jgi:hypothetical protein
MRLWQYLQLLLLHGSVVVVAPAAGCAVVVVVDAVGVAIVANASIANAHSCKHDCLL